MTVKAEVTNDRAIHFYTKNHFKPKRTTSIEIDGKQTPLTELTLSLKNKPVKIDLTYERLNVITASFPRNLRFEYISHMMMAAYDTKF